jgi:chromate transport protein ChrA
VSGTQTTAGAGPGPLPEAARVGAVAPSRRGNSRGARMALLAFILSPLVVVVILCVLIAMSLKSGPKMNEPARGAGAGSTGMYNQHMGGQ